jgi:hypothetical protein
MAPDHSATDLRRQRQVPTPIRGAATERRHPSQFAVKVSAIVAAASKLGLSSPVDKNRQDFTIYSGRLGHGAHLRAARRA